jgi:hypothetical protein
MVLPGVFRLCYARGHTIPFYVTLLFSKETPGRLYLDRGHWHLLGNPSFCCPADSEPISRLFRCSRVVRDRRGAFFPSSPAGFWRRSPQLSTRLVSTDGRIDILPIQKPLFSKEGLYVIVSKRPCPTFPSNHARF